MKTAKEFLPETEVWDLMTSEKELIWSKMIEFAKMHAEAILQAVNNDAKINPCTQKQPCDCMGSPPCAHPRLSEEDIFSVYPLDNIV